MTEAALIFWLMDVMNLPFMDKFDTVYPLNEEFWWWAIFILLIVSELKN